MRDTAEIKPLTQHCQPGQCAIHSHCTQAEVRAALTASMSMVCATETLVRGNEALVEADDGKEEMHDLIERGPAPSYAVGDGLFKICFYILPITCISHFLQSNSSLSFSLPLTSVIGSARTWPCTPITPLACLGHRLKE